MQTKTRNTTYRQKTTAGRLHLLVVVVMLTATMAAVAQPNSGSTYTGAEIEPNPTPTHLAGTLHADQLEIAGDHHVIQDLTLIGTSGVTINGKLLAVPSDSGSDGVTITIISGGLVQIHGTVAAGSGGSHADPAQGASAIGRPGGEGGSIIIKGIEGTAPSVFLAPHTRVIAGDGGAGQSAQAWATLGGIMVQGGPGGRGGDIIFDLPVEPGSKGVIVIGSGGPGGDAEAFSGATAENITAQGGPGGDSGSSYGVPGSIVVPTSGGQEGNATDDTTPNNNATDPEGPDRGNHTSENGPGNQTDDEEAEFWNGTTEGGNGGDGGNGTAGPGVTTHTCSPLNRFVEGADGKDGVPFTMSLNGEQGGDAGSSSHPIKGHDGGHGCDPSPDPNDPSWADRNHHGGDGAKATAQGGDGGRGWVGSGGRGGNAWAEGGTGGNGCPHWVDQSPCKSGGTIDGGHGGHGGDAEARGGQGGTGTQNGGRGGDAREATGGDAGRGGSGDRDVGFGGNGGHGGAAIGFRGHGGFGILGSNGSAGRCILSNMSGGEGGPGGSGGWMDGEDGTDGDRSCG